MNGLFRGINIVEPSSGRGVSVDVEVHNIAVVLHVVVPFEFDIDVVAREVHQLFCDSQFELVAVDGELALADGFPFPSSADVLFDHGFFTVRAGAVDDQVVSVPSGRFVAVDVDQQHHPVAVGRRGQLVGGFDVEVDVVGVA